MPLLSIWGHRGWAGPVLSMNGDPEDWGWLAPSWEPLWGPGLQKGRKDAIHREAVFLCVSLGSEGRRSLPCLDQSRNLAVEGEDNNTW